MPIVIDNKDGYIEKHNYPESMPYRNKHANDMNHFFWGLIMLGGMFIILLLLWVYNCLPFVAVD